MSKADLEKWDARYRAGAYSDRTHPTALLRDHIEALPRGRALDVACGTGRNALFLAESGFDVQAIDISPVALHRGRESAAARGLDVEWIAGDLEAGIAPYVNEATRYSLIVLVRYVDMALVPELARLLADAGVLLVEQHMQTDEADVAGPTSPAFRVAPNALLHAVRDLRVLLYREGIAIDPDGRKAALAQLIASRGEARLPLPDARDGR